MLQIKDFPLPTRTEYSLKILWRFVNNYNLQTKKSMPKSAHPSNIISEKKRGIKPTAFMNLPFKFHREHSKLQFENPSASSILL